MQDGTRVVVRNHSRLPKSLWAYIGEVGTVELIELGSNFRNPQCLVTFDNAIGGKQGTRHPKSKWIRENNLEVIAR